MARPRPAVLLFVLAAACAPAGAEPLPQTLAPAGWGAPSFEDRFASLDAGTDQIRPPHPHRWRTVLGYGGPASPGNRHLSAQSLAVDRGFAGQEGGAPLGIDPFASGPDGLTITARRVPPALAARMWGRPWASGLLSTKFSFSQRHGYFEADMVLPACTRGAWPAFWLLPVTGTWPDNGEIDTPETIGDGKVYWSSKTGKARGGGAQSATPADCGKRWHTYGALWRADRIGYYYDRKLVAEQPTPAGYDTPMFLILNLAVGGSWPGSPDPAIREISMKIRRVSAWPLSAVR